MRNFVRRGILASGGKRIVYYGTATNLATARFYPAAARAGDNAIFAGGNTNVAEAYSPSLVRSTLTNMSLTRVYGSGSSINGYAIFANGYEDANGYNDNLDVYNSSLVRSTLTKTNRQNVDFSPSATSPTYAMFAGGKNNNNYLYGGDYLAVGIAINSSLTLTSITLSYVCMNNAAAAVGEYVLFAGGVNRAGTVLSTVNAFNASRTRSTPTALSVARYDLAGVSVGVYALFLGGYGTAASKVVDAYNESLVRSTPTEIGTARYGLRGIHTDDKKFALIGGGYISAVSKLVDCYNDQLVRTSLTDLNTARRSPAVTNYKGGIMFGPGGASSNIVDVYQYK